MTIQKFVFVISVCMLGGACQNKDQIAISVAGSFKEDISMKEKDTTVPNNFNADSIEPGAYLWLKVKSNASIPIFLPCQYYKSKLLYAPSLLRYYPNGKKDSMWYSMVDCFQCDTLFEIKPLSTTSIYSTSLPIIGSLKSGSDSLVLCFPYLIDTSIHIFSRFEIKATFKEGKMSSKEEWFHL